MDNTTIKDYEIMAPVGSRESLMAAIQAGAVCDALKPAFCNADSVNLCETLFGQVLCGVGGNIAANLF